MIYSKNKQVLLVTVLGRTVQSSEGISIVSQYSNASGFTEVLESLDSSLHRSATAP